MDDVVEKLRDACGSLVLELLLVLVFCLNIRPASICLPVSKIFCANISGLFSCIFPISGTSGHSCDLERPSLFAVDDVDFVNV